MTCSVEIAIGAKRMAWLENIRDGLLERGEEAV